MIHFNDYAALKKALSGYEKIFVIIDAQCARLLATSEHFAKLAQVLEEASVWRFCTAADCKSASQNRTDKTASQNRLFILPQGESAKSFSVLERVLDALCEANLSRKDCVLNIGGGITSDLGGLAAALYKRGCAHINIATTLLAAADASIGGKTGINNSFGKNLIGVFKEPEEVFIFDDLLATLPREQSACGWAEMIKMIACFDAPNYARVGELSEQDALKIAINIKRDVVAKDLRESGLRMLLNYGHTFAHAIEHEQNYEILHGQAVAVGMLMADELARNLGLLSEEPAILRCVLAAKNCQTSYKIQNLDEFIACMQKDKKNTSERCTFILRTDAGAICKSDVAPSALEKVLKNWL